MEVPVLCSWHLTLATSRDIVAGKYEDLPVAPYDAGMFIWAGFDTSPAGIPEDLRQLVLWAKRYNYEWVRLDGIGDTRDDLTTYKDTWS